MPLPQGCELVAFSDAMLLPGLIDTHVHLCGDGGLGGDCCIEGRRRSACSSACAAAAVSSGPPAEVGVRWLPVPGGR
jgi:predicted amidohydrolase YtcJ